MDEDDTTVITTDDTSKPINTGAANVTTEVKGQDAKADEAKADEAKADEVKADEAKADEAKADEAKADEAKADEAKADEAKADEAKADEAVTYELKVPEGVEVAPQVSAAFTEAATKHKLSQEQAQGLYAEMSSVIADAQEAQLQELKSAWETAVLADPDIGGDKLAETLAVARQGMEAVATPQVKELLDSTGLGNHPDVVKMFKTIGEALASDSDVVTGSAPETQERQYPNSNMNI